MNNKFDLVDGFKNNLVLSILTALAFLFSTALFSQAYISDDLRPYVDEFLDINELYGNEFEMPAKGFFVVFDTEVEQVLPDHVLGRALGMFNQDLSFNDDLVYVMINAKQWNEMDHASKRKVITHELMHDLYNVEHNDDEESLMYYANKVDNNLGATNKIHEAFSSLKK